MDETITEEDMIKEWGSPEEYYKEKEEFLKRHCNADLRTVTSNTGALVKVEYLFKPFTVVTDNRELRRKLAATSADSE